MTASRLPVRCALTLLLGMIVSSPVDAAPPKLKFLQIETIDKTSYFHVRFEAPNDWRIPSFRGAYTEWERRKTAQMPHLIPRDASTHAIYHRTKVRHFLPQVGFTTNAIFRVEGLEFVGKVKRRGKARFWLVYPNGHEPALTRRKSALAKTVQRAKWVRIPITLDFTRAAKRPWEQTVNLRTLWAQGQAARFAALEMMGGEFGFFGFACAATGRKYGVEDPVIARVKKQDREQVHRRMFHLVTAGSAITSSLALHRMTDRNYVDRNPRTIPIGSVQGITIAEHPWKRMMAGKTPGREPLARFAPHDNWYIHVRNVSKAAAVWDMISQWGGNVTQMYELASQDYQLQKRYETQLCLPVNRVRSMPRLDLIRGVAVTGNDPYLREGSDLTIMMHVRQPKLLLAGLEHFIDDARREFAGQLRERRRKYQGVLVEEYTTPLREVSLHRAVMGDVVVYSNSRIALQRVIDAHERRAKSLADSLDFQYMRTIFRVDDKEEDAFVFLSDAFIRQLVGPASKIKVARRLEAATSLTMLHNAALFSAWETGETPKSHGELLRAAKLHSSHIWIPEGKRIAWDGKRQRAVSDAYNTLQFQTPLVELPIDKITTFEEREYRLFRREYVRLWRRFFDPVGMRFSLNKDRMKAEVYVLPLVFNNEYNSFRDLAGRGTIRIHPKEFSPRTLLEFKSHMNSARILGNFGDWGLIRLDDSAKLNRLADYWIYRDYKGVTDEIDVNAIGMLLDLPVTLGLHVKNKKNFDNAWRMAEFYLAQYLKIPVKKRTDYHGARITHRVVADSDLLKQDPNLRKLLGTRIYHTQNAGAAYLGFDLGAIRNIVDEGNANKKKKVNLKETVSVNATFYLSPKAAVKAKSALHTYIEWETHKRSLPNNAVWQALYECGVVTPQMRDSERRRLALQYLGWIPITPDGSVCYYDPSLREVVNRRHGSSRRPMLHSGVAPRSTAAQLLSAFPSMRVDMRFREDGLHTTIVLQRK